MSKRLLVILVSIFLFCFLQTSGWSQISFHQLPRYRSTIGFAFTQSKWELYDVEGSIRSFSSSIDYGYMPNVKISFLPGVRFISSKTNVDVPPSPTANVAFMSQSRLPGSNLHYYFTGGIGSSYTHTTGRVYGGVNDTYHTLGGIGIFHRLDTKEDLVFIPFFSVNYVNHWVNLSTDNRIYDDSTDQLVSGHAGMEMEISENVSILGAWNFSFMESGGTITIGVNFY